MQNAEKLSALISSTQKKVIPLFYICKCCLNRKWLILKNGSKKKDFRARCGILKISSQSFPLACVLHI